MNLTSKLKIALVFLCCTAGVMPSCKKDDACVAATTVNAGDDQNVIGTSTTLNANSPASGTGTWTIVSGDGGELGDPKDPKSSFSGDVGSSYTLRWTITGCPVSQDDVVVAFTSSDPALLTVDKTSVINGEIITVTGLNFSSNYNGGSQINSIKSADPYTGDIVYLPILSRTATEIIAVVVGTHGGANGEYNLQYSKKPDAGAATLYPSSLNINITSGEVGGFFTSSTFTATNLTQGDDASFGIKNGTTTVGDYTIKLVGYDYTTGASTEYNATVTDVTAAGYDTMDKITFTIPADLPNGEYYVKITYGGKTLIGGWGTSLNIF